MRIAILYNEAGEDATVDAQDVLVQRAAVATALARRGHEVTSIAVTLDLAAAKFQLLAATPNVVFNLVEALGGTDRLAMLATLLYDALGIAYTGAPTAALFATNNKLVAKEHLVAAGLPTPAWLTDDARGGELAPGEKVIVKAVWEHASFGIDDAAVFVPAAETAIAREIARRRNETSKQYFAEAFIAGREFNLSILAGEVLPPAEIDFSALPPEKLHIVDYRAKWDESSFEYHHTPRRFEFPARDELLLGQLTSLAQQCWTAFRLRGYARVDFRVDDSGRPFILEVNANPCLSPDAGFAAAVEQAGIGYDEAIERIVRDALS
jgi:D-alanine-D-alanine ligase